MVNSWAELYDIYVHSKAISAGLLQLNISIYGTCLEVRPKFISCRIYISPRYLMISLIVPKLETNFLQRNYLGRQSLAEADTLCDTFHFGHFKNTNSGSQSLATQFFYGMTQQKRTYQPWFGISLRLKTCIYSCLTNFPVSIQYSSKFAY